MVNKKIPTLYIIVGLPASGKSTYIKKLKKENGISLAYDDFFGHKKKNKKYSEKEIVRELRKAKSLVVADIQFCDQSVLIKFLHDISGAKFQLVIINCVAGKNKLKERSKKRRLVKKSFSDLTRAQVIENELNFIENNYSGYYPIVSKTVIT